MNFSNISSPIVSAFDEMADCIPDQSSLGSSCVPGDGEMLFMSNPEEILDAGRANPGELHIDASFLWIFPDDVIEKLLQLYDPLAITDELPNFIKFWKSIS